MTIRSKYLTRREYDVLELIALQCTSNEIAEILFISTETVSTHRKKLIIKLGARNSVGMVLNAFHRGILTLQNDRSSFA